MSRQLLKKNIIVLAVLCLIMVFAGCSQEPIFWSIEHEVVLSKASIIGNIYAVKGFNGNIYAANGYLYAKSINAAPGTEWGKRTLPDNLRCIGLAVDSSHLYGLFNYIDSSQNLVYSVYSYDGSQWTQVTLPANQTPCAIFDDGTAASPKAFVTLKSTGSTTEYTVAPLSTSSVTAYSNSSNEPFSGAASYNSTVYFGAKNGIWKLDANAVQKVANTPSDTVGIVANTKFLYTVTNNTVHYWDGSNWQTTSPGFGVPQSLSIVSADSKLLIGTASGYRQVGIDSSSGVPSGSLIPLPSNTDAAIGSYLVRNIYVAEGANVANNTYVLYASVFDTTDGARSGLWGYYYPNRQEWNRE